MGEGARSGRWLDAPQDAVVVGWSDVHRNDPLTFHDVFPRFLKDSFAFRIYFLKYRFNQSKTAFEACVVLFLPLGDSGGGCVIEYPSAKRQSSALFCSLLPPKESAKTVPKAALTALMAPSALLSCSSGGYRRSGAALSSIHKPENLPRHCLNKLLQVKAVAVISCMTTECRGGFSTSSSSCSVCRFSCLFVCFLNKVRFEHSYCIGLKPLVVG